MIKERESKLRREEEEEGGVEHKQAVSGDHTGTCPCQNSHVPFCFVWLALTQPSQAVSMFPLHPSFAPAPAPTQFSLSPFPSFLVVFKNNLGRSIYQYTNSIIMRHKRQE